MRNLIVGLTSPARGGKDMVADILAEQLGVGTPFDVHKFRFADPLKRLAGDLFGWCRGALNDNIKFKETPDPKWGGITPRDALQIIGTELFRDGPLKTEYGINIWRDYMKNRIVEHLERMRYDQVILIPDCRFMNEFELIKELGGVMVFMDPRPRIKEKTRVHASEKDMWIHKDYDHVIDTGDTMEKTRIEAEALAQHFYNQLVMEDN